MDLKLFFPQISQKDGDKLLGNINTLLKNDNKHKFPGYQPVSFMRCHINNLVQEDYLVCEKTDGVRALLYVFSIEKRTFSFFLDRKNTFYRLSLVFSQTIENSLFDGEVVVETEKEDSSVHFVICDAILFNNSNISRMSHIDRLGYALKFTRLHVYNAATDSLRISVKEMQKSYGMHWVYSQMDKLEHGSDGLIFTPVNMPYRSGTAPKLLKWKPPHLNSVDFIIKKNAEWTRLYELFCLDNEGKPMFFDYYFDLTLSLESDSSEEAYHDEVECSRDQVQQDLDERLGEFKFDGEKWIYDLSDLSLVRGGWALIKLRNDKNTPNSVSVVINVMNSIKEDISMSSLVKYVPEIRKRWKLREAEKVG